MYTIRVSDGVDKVIAKWKKSNPNLFKKYKKIYIQSQYEQEAVFNEIKNEIIEIYCNIQYQLKLLKIAKLLRIRWFFRCV